MSWVYFTKDEKSTDPKVWIRGNIKTGPVLGGTTSYLQGKYGVGIRIESVNKGNSHSWVRISHGLNKLVTDLIDKKYDDNEQETSETKTGVFAFASRSKVKAKPRRPSTSCSSSRTVHILEWKWTDIEPRAQSDQAYPVAKRLNTFFDTENYFEKKMVRSNSGDWKMIFGKNLSILNVGLMHVRARWQEAEATRKDFNTVLTRQDNKCFTSELFKVIQDAIPLILHHTTMCWFRTISSSTYYQIGCAVSLHSITNSGLIAGGQNSSRERQTVFFTVVNPMNEKHKDPQELDLTKPRLASYKQKWKRHQDTVYWDSIQLAQRIGLKFYQSRSNATILYDTLPAFCISKVIVMKSEEIIYQKEYVSPRPPPKIIYKENWMYDLDSDIAGSSKDTQRIQPKPKIQLSRTGRPVCGHESTKRCVLAPKHVEEYQTGTGRPVLVHQKEEHEIDFRIPGLAHAVVKEAEHLRVQELVKRIENLPHREALNADLQQNNVYSPFSKNLKAMSVNRVMWSYSSCAELFQMHNVLTVFFIGIKELCIVLADNAWLTANPEESFTN